MSLQKMLDSLAKATFGMTKSEAHARSICIRCKEDVNVSGLATVDRDEYNISAFCPKCYSELGDEDE